MLEIKLTREIREGEREREGREEEGRKEAEGRGKTGQEEESSMKRADVDCQ